jgi:hypothetical protein
MPTDDVRKKLLAEYAAALVEERTSWERLSDPLLSELERYHIYARWKPASDRLKNLVHELREPAPAAMVLRQDETHASQRPG